MKIKKHEWIRILQCINIIILTHSPKFSVHKSWSTIMLPTHQSTSENWLFPQIIVICLYRMQYAGKKSWIAVNFFSILFPYIQFTFFFISQFSFRTHFLFPFQMLKPTVLPSFYLSSLKKVWRGQKWSFCKKN